jgi:protoporphyrinogen oxidase
MTGVEVVSVREHSTGLLEIATTDQHELFDRVIFTGPVNVMRRIVSPMLVEAPTAVDVEYLGVVCLVLVTRRSIVPFYVVNISDESVPFTGVIGMTSLVSTEETGGLHLTYCPKYVPSDDVLLRL